MAKLYGQTQGAMSATIAPARRVAIREESFS